VISMEKLPGLPAGSVILQQQGVQHSWYQGPTGPEPGLLTIDHPMPHTTNQADLVNPVNMNSVGGGDDVREAGWGGRPVGAHEHCRQ